MDKHSKALICWNQLEFSLFKLFEIKNDWTVIFSMHSFAFCVCRFVVFSFIFGFFNFIICERVEVSSFQLCFKRFFFGKNSKNNFNNNVMKNKAIRIPLFSGAWSFCVCWSFCWLVIPFERDCWIYSSLRRLLEQFKIAYRRQSSLWLFFFAIVLRLNRYQSTNETYIHNGGNTWR